MYVLVGVLIKLTSSVIQNIHVCSRMVGQLACNGLESIWEQPVFFRYEIMSQNLTGGNKDIARKTSPMIIKAPAVILHCTHYE